MTPQHDGWQPRHHSLRQLEPTSKPAHFNVGTFCSRLCDTKSNIPGEFSNPVFVRQNQVFSGKTWSFPNPNQVFCVCLNRNLIEHNIVTTENGKKRKVSTYSTTGLQKRTVTTFLAIGLILLFENGPLQLVLEYFCSFLIRISLKLTVKKD